MEEPKIEDLGFISVQAGRPGFMFPSGKCLSDYKMQITAGIEVLRLLTAPDWATLVQIVSFGIQFFSPFSLLFLINFEVSEDLLAANSGLLKNYVFEELIVGDFFPFCAQRLELAMAEGLCGPILAPSHACSVKLCYDKRMTYNGKMKQPVTSSSFSIAPLVGTCTAKVNREINPKYLPRTVYPIFFSKMRRNDSADVLESDRHDHSAFSQTDHNIVAAYLITAGIISIVSNIVVLGIFVKFKELRTATNAIIINLAVTDIGVSGIGYPMSAASDLHGSWKFGYAGCQIYAGLNIFFGMSSIGLLTVVAIDRYLTICRPVIGRKMTSSKYTAMILAAWTNGFFWASMPLLGWASYASDPTGATCTINWRKNDASFISYTMTVIAVNFALPFVIMFYCYYNVSQTMKQYPASKALENLSIDWSEQVDVTKMSVVMILMFLVAWSPYSIVCLWSSFGDPEKISPAMAIMAPLFAKSSTFYNPCIYVVANKKFRRAILSMVQCQTHQEITITNVLPMNRSRSPH
ncbi:visual pigment-like receptor peropsin [Tachyglossus aculeatus]|uniref:visual pigment-like receptor peropsin n=1 Tax=Tachyglossus aculeatus TaxID=9261 RepID=UPI0018F544DB|nr:visual pigment-like receptor peropsin [Tachyglossus aculeatus]